MDRSDLTVKTRSSAAAARLGSGRAEALGADPGVTHFGALTTSLCDSHLGDVDDSARQNLTENLRRLVQDRGNISHVCDRIGINRQQFNKYLSGQHSPSRYNINLICQYFRISYGDLIAPDFKLPETRQSLDDLPGLRALAESPLLRSLLASSDRERMRNFTGTYLKYHASSIYKGNILRALTVIRPFRDLYAYTNIERFPARGSTRRHDYVFKYRGLAFLIEDRVFLMDFESVQRNEMTFSIYSPVIRNPMRFMFGVTSGIAATQFREPYMAKAVLELISTEPVSRTDLTRATVIAPDDSSLPRDVADYLSP
jgi:transcriptional regulator with XRE-family HTH domain